MDKCNASFSNTRRLGIVDSVEGDSVKVCLQRTSACVSCEHPEKCFVHGGKKLVVDVFKESSVLCNVGDEVEVELSDRGGLKAVFVGFFIPLLLMLISVLAANIFGCSDSKSALVAFALLIIYYIIIYMLRNIIERKFRIRLTRVVQNRKPIIQ